MIKLRVQTVTVLFLCMTLLIAYVALEFSYPFKLGKQVLIDFDVFHLASVMIREGNLNQAYDAGAFMQRQSELPGFKGTLLLWSYPPTYDLTIIPLGWAPAWLAYLLFISSTLVMYLYVLKRISSVSFQTILVLSLPVVFMIIRAGQNGFLTGALMGASCYLALNRKAFAGIPLGLMAIKPHLAVGFGIWSLLDRRWAMVAFSLLVVAAFSAVSWMAFGSSAWEAFFGSISQTSGILGPNGDLLYRMSSVYALFQSIGSGRSIAMGFHILVILIGFVFLLRAKRNGITGRDFIGVGILFSAIISPYNYDYDLGTLFVGLAVLMPTLDARLSRTQIYTLWGACWSIGMFAFIISYSVTFSEDDVIMVPALLALPVLTICYLSALAVTKNARVSDPA